MQLVDKWLNKITMYRLVLYVLIVILTAAAILGFAGKFPFGGYEIILSTLFLVAASWITNKIFAVVFEAPTNVESVYITALILALIISPAGSLHDFIFLGWAAIAATASKYILAVGKKHIFNPAAMAVVITAYGIGQSASWWVGNLPMMPLVIAGGWLVVRKIRHEKMVGYFLAAAVATVLAFTLLKGNNVLPVLNEVLLHSSLWFFAFIMVTEPLTTPPTRKLRAIYALLVGILFAPQIHIGPVFSTPELALVLGNIFSYAVSPKTKLVLHLKDKLLTAPDTYDFVFPLAKKIKFIPGQYMEFTLAHSGTDERGNRRYFTLASSPTEQDVRIGVKFYNPSSSFKKTMLAMNEVTPLTMTQLAGDFVMPKDTAKKLVFMAGGIGITPFRSMVKYMIDTRQKRDVILMYSNKNASEIVYKSVFDQAQNELGLKTVYTITDTANVPAGWTGKTGRMDKNMIETEVPDYKERVFYLSGPHAMVTAFEETLKGMGVKASRIVTDYFPGYV